MAAGRFGEPTDDNDLVYLRARYLNPEMGVFPSLDPFEGVIQRAMSLNGYSWVEGNVPNMADPSGKISESPGSWDTCLQSQQNCNCDRYLPLDFSGYLDCLRRCAQPRTPLTIGLGSPANDVVPQVSDCSSFTGPFREACETLQRIQQEWPASASRIGPTYSEIVALVIGTEWYMARASTGISGTDCSGLQLGDVLELAMAHQFWYWYNQPADRLENTINFLAYFHPIREQRIGNRPRGTIFEEGPGNVQDLINKSGIYSESDMLNHLRSIFDPNNPFAIFTRENPGRGVNNCPYGFANRPDRNRQSYSVGDALIEFPNQFKVLSFAQQTSGSPSTTACSSFETLRRQARCQPQPLSGLPE